MKPGAGLAAAPFSARRQVGAVHAAGGTGPGSTDGLPAPAPASAGSEPEAPSSSLLRHPCSKTQVIVG